MLKAWLNKPQISSNNSNFFNWYIGGGVQLRPLGTAATNRPIVLAPDHYDGEIGGIIGTPQAARTRSRAAAVGSQRLTA
jgi:hypothetical protein